MITKWQVVRHKWFAYQTKPQYLYFNMQKSRLVYFSYFSKYEGLDYAILMGTPCRLELPFKKAKFCWKFDWLEQHWIHRYVMTSLFILLRHIRAGMAVLAQSYSDSCQIDLVGDFFTPELIMQYTLARRACRTD